jgi:hypothetical protein
MPSLTAVCVHCDADLGTENWDGHKCPGIIACLNDGPSPTTWEAALDRVLAEMRSVMVQRQDKYGPNNIVALGLHGVLSRALADKGARLMGALNGRVVRGQIQLDPIVDSEATDTFTDGCLDLANYAGPIALMLQRGWWTLPRLTVAKGD